MWRIPILLGEVEPEICWCAFCWWIGVSSGASGLSDAGGLAAAVVVVVVVAPPVVGASCAFSKKTAVNHLWSRASQQHLVTRLETGVDWRTVQKYVHMWQSKKLVAEAGMINVTAQAGVSSSFVQGFASPSLP